MIDKDPSAPISDERVAAKKIEVPPDKPSKLDDYRDQRMNDKNNDWVPEPPTY